MQRKTPVIVTLFVLIAFYGCGKTERKAPATKDSNQTQVPETNEIISLPTPLTEEFSPEAFPCYPESRCDAYNRLSGSPDQGEVPTVLALGDSILAMMSYAHVFISEDFHPICQSTGHYIGFALQPQKFVDIKAASGQTLMPVCSESCQTWQKGDDVKDAWCPRNCLEVNPELADFPQLCSEECITDFSYYMGKCDSACSPNIPTQYEVAQDQYGPNHFEWVVMDGGGADLLNGCEFGPPFACGDEDRCYEILDDLAVENEGGSRIVGGAMKEMIDKIKAEQQGVKIALLGYAVDPCYWENGPNHFFTLNKRYRLLASQYDNVHFIDLNKALSVCDDAGQCHLNTDWISYETLYHPTAKMTHDTYAGVEKVAEVISKVIRNN